MISSRMLLGAGAAVCAALLAFGYYLQYVEGQEPCPLCLVQRGFYYGVGAVFLAGALRGTGNIGYPIGAFVLALGGAGIAGRQVWLQHLPPERVPACGPDLFYMLQNFPLGRTIAKLVTGTGECAEVKWRFLGLSIADWSLAWFVALAVLALWIGFRRQLPTQSPQ